jgi:hypothetical protein
MPAGHCLASSAHAAQAARRAAYNFAKLHCPSLAASPLLPAAATSMTTWPTLRRRQAASPSGSSSCTTPHTWTAQHCAHGSTAYQQHWRHHCTAQLALQQQPAAVPGQWGPGGGSAAALMLPRRPCVLCRVLLSCHQQVGLNLHIHHLQLAAALAAASMRDSQPRLDAAMLKCHCSAADKQWSGGWHALEPVAPTAQGLTHIVPSLCFVADLQPLLHAFKDSCFLHEPCRHKALGTQCCMLCLCALQCVAQWRSCCQLMSQWGQHLTALLLLH